MHQYYKSLLCGFVTIALSVPYAYSAGFKRIKTDTMDMGIWYPSDGSPKKLKMSIRYFNVAENGTPESGTFDIVVFSHGIGGRYRNHYITAQAIADAGYIVVAPDHTADKMIGGPAMIGALENRVGELQTAIDMVRKDPQLSTSNTIHGVGYSLGGKTIILASGAGEDVQISQKHCSENSFKDPQYCYYTNDKAVDDEKFCKSPKWEFTG